MNLDFDEIRRYAHNNETPAGVSLILAHLRDDSMTAGRLCRLCPLRLSEADYILALLEVDQWGHVPEHKHVDYAYTDEASEAYETAFCQLLHRACCKVARVIGQ